MGARGPAPKREAERRRRNKTTESGESMEVTKISFDEAELEKMPIEAPETPDDWHETAKNLYASLQTSGTRIFMEPSDWATAYMICEQVHLNLQPQPLINADGDFVDMVVYPMKGATLAAVIKGLGQLGVTEESRRRMRIELDRGNTGPTLPQGATGSNVTSIRKNRLGA